MPDNHYSLFYLSLWQTKQLSPADYSTISATHFILDENKDNNHKAEIDNKNSINETLKERIAHLEFENGTLTADNQKLKEWTQSIPGNVSYFNKKKN